MRSKRKTSKIYSSVLILLIDLAWSSFLNDTIIKYAVCYLKMFCIEDKKNKQRKQRILKKKREIDQTRFSSFKDFIFVAL